MRRKARNSYIDINRLIIKEHHLFTVENVINEYRAFKRGCWIPYPIITIIYKCENQIKTILKYKNKQNGLPSDY